MDQEAQLQTEAEKAAVREKAAAYLSEMDQATSSFDKFCKDMQAVVNELSSFDITEYLWITRACDHLQTSMTIATRLSELFINHERDHPHRILHHIRRVREKLSVMRQTGNRIVDSWVRPQAWSNPPHRLRYHMSLLKGDVRRILSITRDDARVSMEQAAGETSAGHTSEAQTAHTSEISQTTSQEDLIQDTLPGEGYLEGD